MSVTVRDLMTADVKVVAPETPYKAIAQLMVSADVTAVPVLSEGTLVGIVTETDMLHKEEFRPQYKSDEYDAPLRARLRRKLGVAGSARNKAKARDARGLMNTGVVTIGVDESPVAAARTMDRHDVKQLPVLDEQGHLIGIVNRRDMLRIFTRSDADISADIGAALEKAPDWLTTDELSFAVQDGLVTLEGRLDLHSHVTVLTQLLRGTDGVVGVDSKVNWRVNDVLPAGHWGL